MPKSKTASDSDTGLAAKVDFLIVVTAGRFNPEHGRQSEIAKTLGMHPTRWAAVRNGRKPVPEAVYGRLAAYFRLQDYGLDYTMFHLPTLGEFKRVWSEHQPRPRNVTGRPMFDQADNLRAAGLAIQQVASRREGGIGAKPKPGPKIFKEGDEVIIAVDHPEGGYVALFNDCPDGELVCLVPSYFHRQAAATGTRSSFPGLGTRARSFPISGAGEYRLYALWTRVKWPVIHDQDTLRDDRLPVLAAEDLRRIATEIERCDRDKSVASPAYEVRRADYKVEA
jgi:hypothetical protein